MMRVLAPRSIGLTTASLGALVALGANGCAGPGARPPASPPTTTSAPRPEPRPVAIAFSMARPGEGPPLMAGQTSVGHGPLRVESDETPRRGKASLELRAHRREDGTIEVAARYAENDGQTKITWEPSVHLAPKAAGTVTVSGAGWSRELTITAE